MTKSRVRSLRLVAEAQYEYFVITDSDVRVGPDYPAHRHLPFRDPHVGAATCLYSFNGKNEMSPKDYNPSA